MMTKNSLTRLIDLAIAIQQIPAPTFHEAERARFVQTCFIEQGLVDVSLDRAGNVLARLAAYAQVAVAEPPAKRACKWARTCASSYAASMSRRAS